MRGEKKNEWKRQKERWLKRREGGERESEFEGIWGRSWGKKGKEGGKRRRKEGGRGWWWERGGLELRWRKSWGREK